MLNGRDRLSVRQELELASSQETLIRHIYTDNSWLIQKNLCSVAGLGLYWILLFHHYHPQESKQYT